MFISKHVHYFNLLNVAALVGLSYLQIQDFNNFPTIIIPLLLGAIMLPMNNSLRTKRKQILKVAAVITILALLSLVYPSIQIFLKGDNTDILRITIMIITTFVSMIGLLYCVKETKDNLL